MLLFGIWSRLEWLRHLVQVEEEVVTLVQKAIRMKLLWDQIMQLGPVTEEEKKEDWEVIP
ncbi:hypothetical protein D3C71_720830 [compost metagenome]